ncbi:MAG: preprotein translocase subunit SecA [SAR86 cluster bacterium]|uniref:Protein translocase subunit SecA n=1 Tax=SAR86 cluster bacterium TaxID=2030880 RepID=A0A520N3E0_9GAMM|nr:MAG: preprotein translocase subunit SecA [SAR86 cluster bacterium]
MLNFFSNIFGSSNDRTLKKMMVHVSAANNLEKELSEKPDEYFLSLKTELQKKYTENDKNIYAILPHAFAAVREASKRTLGLRHFDSQMLGGISLAEGNIAEMKTGEGKTLVATLPAYLNSVIGNKAILVTVNDYLAKRDAEWMRPIYEFLGLKVGVVNSNQMIQEKITSYKCDVIYATNNELGFDYLRDNMAHSVEERVQCSLDFAIVDEVDSILIDEARTPLIISGPSSESSDLYRKIRKFIPKLTKQLREETEEEPLTDDEKGHYLIDEKNKSVELTDDGYILVEELLEESEMLGDSEGLYSVSNLQIMKFVQATLRAHFLFQKNVHYLVRNNEVLLIDEHTGRTMPGRRMSEGVHQALECKENVPIQRESQTLASTTFQNFFRLFKNLSGMTGTADTEAIEFNQIYGLNVIIIPTNVPMVRNDHNDLVFLTKKAKYKALVEEIVSLRENHAPILVGTVSVESSEEVSEFLKAEKIPHQILNAKHHEKEAEVIANAGKPSMVTIATNMAGRGTDIVLGGKKEDQDNDEWYKNNEIVLKSGGLHILGTERHESRRIDNQLRGRSGRQGDPGYSRFFLSLEDDLLRLFISDNRRDLFERIGMGDDHIEHRMLSKGIENAQKRIESRNFDARKNLLEYDDVSNDQRQAIYSLRNQLLEEKDISESIDELIGLEFKRISNTFIPEESIESQWRIKDLDEFLKENYKLETDIENIINNDKKLLPESIASIVIEKAKQYYKDKYKSLESNRLLLEKQIMLQVLDVHWKEHLAEIDHLRGSVGLRAYAQKNPKNEFKQEAYSMFEAMLDEIDIETVRILFAIEFATEEIIENLKKDDDKQEMVLEKPSPSLDNSPEVKTEEIKNPGTFINDQPKHGRNEIVKITNGQEVRNIKYKKAESLIETGEWKII